MSYLILVSLFWAFSFGLIKTYLSETDPYLVSFLRIALSLIIFLPFLRISRGQRSLNIKFIMTGMVQFGLMYIAYIYSYRFLEAWQVALYTIYTPIYITLLNDFLTRRFHPVFFVAAILSVAGTALILEQNMFLWGHMKGYLTVQISNVAFAFGQVYYKRLIASAPQVRQVHVFGLLYVGAFLLTGITAGLFTDWESVQLGREQWLTLLYLGAIASGIGFFVWNYGTTITHTGAVAVLNNLKVPLAVVVTLLVFGGSVDLLKLCTGGGIIFGALILSEWRRPPMES